MAAAVRGEGWKCVREGKGKMSTPKKELTKIDLYSMGYSPKEIARIKGLTVKEVEDWIRRNGIKTEKDIKENKPKTRKEKIRELISW